MIKKLSVAITLLLFFISCTTTAGDPGYNQPVYYGPGIGLGTIIAVVIHGAGINQFFGR